jgi:hypothetical protein
LRRFARRVKNAGTGVCRTRSANRWFPRLSFSQHFESGIYSPSKPSRGHSRGIEGASGQISGHGGAAERPGLKRKTLQNQMRRLGICKGEYQTPR